MSIDYEAVRNPFVAIAKAKIGSKLATLKTGETTTTPAVVKARQNLPPKPAYPYCVLDIQAARHNPNDYDGMFLSAEGKPVYYTRVELLLSYTVYGGDAISILNDLWLCFRQTSVRDYLRNNGHIALNRIEPITTSSYKIPNDWVDVAAFNIYATVMDEVVATDETWIQSIVADVTATDVDGTITSTDITTYPNNDITFRLVTQGLNDNTTFVDSSTNNLAVITRGNIHTVNPSPALGSSAYFGGVGDGNYLEVSPTLLLNTFGTGNFKIAGFIYCEDVNAERSIISCKLSSLTGPWDNDLVYDFVVIPNGKLAFYAGNGATIQIESSSGVLLNNTLCWVEATRVNGTTYLFANGELLGSFTETVPVSVGDSRAQTYIGAWAHYDNQTPFKGYIPEILICKGVGGNTESYTPPNAII